MDLSRWEDLRAGVSCLYQRRRVDGEAVEEGGVAEVAVEGFLGWDELLIGGSKRGGYR